MDEDEHDRRAQYRVAGSSDVQAFVVTGAGKADSPPAVPVRLLDVSFGGAGFLSDGLDLAGGQAITLRIDSSLLFRPLDVGCTVRTRAPLDGGGVRYGVKFVDPDGLIRRVPPKLVGLFNRRGAFRVAPESAEPIVARLASPGEVELPVISLSATGLALFARSTEEQILLAGDEVRLSFVLPGAGEPCAIAGKVRYAKPQSGGVRYGIELDPNATPLFGRYQDRIMKYVMDQQRKMLRKA